MSVKCGRCQGYHPSVQDVRACYNGQSVPTDKAARPTGECLSPKQVNMVNILLRKLGLVWEDTEPIEGLPRWQEGRKLIDQLKGCEYNQAHGKPWRLPEGTKISARPQSKAAERSGGQRKPFPEVPAGHYAVKSLTGNNDLDFFRVDRPTEGPWAGRTFVKRVIGGKPDSPVRGRTMREALEAILAEGVEAARLRYGREIGQCWKCNRHLTDELSRQRGIGPDCYTKVGGAAA
jgi:uncharacterized protein DUF6011